MTRKKLLSAPSFLLQSFFCFYLLLLLSARHAAAQTPPSPTTLADLKDQYRPLLIFAPTPNDPGLLAQLTQLRHEAPGLEQRQVLLIAVPYRNPAPTELALTPADAEAARRRFHIAPTDFVVMLIGKDGGEKLRSHKPVRWDRLRNTIDAMPMRQQEMRQQPHGSER